MTLAESRVPRAIDEVTAGWLSEALRAGDVARKPSTSVPFVSNRLRKTLDSRRCCTGFT